MFEDMGSQSILLIAGSVLLGGIVLTAAYFLCKAAWRHKRRVAFIAAGMLPGLLIGYLAGNGTLSAPSLPTLAKHQPTTPRPASKVVLRLTPTPEEMAAEEQPPQEHAPADLISGEQTLRDPIAGSNDLSDHEALETLKPALQDDESLPQTHQEPSGGEDQIPPEPLDPETEDEISSAENTASAPAPEMPEITQKSATQEPGAAFLPRPKPDAARTGSTPPASEPSTSSDPITAPATSEPLTEADRLKQERLADAKDYIAVGELIIEDHPGGAVVQYKKALEVYKEYGTEQQLGKAYHDLGFASLRAGDLDDATKYTLTALKTGQQLGDQLMVTRALTNLGFIYMNKRDPANALIYYNQALSEAEGAPASLALAMLQENIAYAYGAEGDNDKAIEHLKAALEIANQLESTGSVEDLKKRIASNTKDYQ